MTGRAIFVRSNDAGFRRFLRFLDRPSSSLTKVFCQEIQSIERFDYLQSNEQIQGFPGKWRKGRVELVLHPTHKSEEEQTDFLLNLFRGHGLDWQTTRVVSYPNGPTFVSCYLTSEMLSEVAEANPLRAAHPLIFRRLEDLRGATHFPAPPPPVSKTRSTIKVGMFDGGVDVSLPHLQGHVEEDQALSIKTKPNSLARAHGTAVAGVILYGPMNDWDTKQPLPPPSVSVVSVRCLPTTNPRDADLYESIDIIEAAVPRRPDVSFWNIAFGPRGAYRDDNISRFTYVLDNLARERKVEPVVAVGNDGEAGADLNKIQAPSDLVNGMGIGAFTRRQGKIVHAPYSCRGQGRECAKNKPDLVAFGGCDQNPIHLLSTVPGEKLLSQGTSFAAPQVTALGGQTLGTFDRATPLLARALLLHRAKHPDGEPDYLLGHGILPASVEEVLTCSTNEVSIIFQGTIPPRKTLQLPLLLPAKAVTAGNVEISWTVACLPPVAPSHPADYTMLCIEDTFYPNKRDFVFSKTFPNGKVKTLKRNLKTDQQEVAEMLADGWKQAGFPASDSGNEYQTEADRRAQCKWEPVVRRAKNKQARSLDEPFLTLHAIPRHGATESLDYAVVVTIRATKPNGDLYDAVLRRFTALQPIRLRSEAELRVQI